MQMTLDMKTKASVTPKLTVADEMAMKQREIGVAEFFSKNRHLLGFDNKKKALLTTVKEAVDNSLDACEEARILPELIVEVIDMGNERYKAIIEDNGPGIVKKQVPNIFARLLYGSKFHSMKQSRGQQGIGISASVMYGQLTTGRAAKIITRCNPNEPAYYCELKLNTHANNPQILGEREMEWYKPTGTRIEIDLEALYQQGMQSVDEFLKETAITNPHATIIYTNPKAEQLIFARATDQLPAESKEIKPHPYGVELGMLMDMLATTETKTLQSFFTTEFSRVGATAAKQICENARILPNTKPHEVSREMADRIIKGIKETKLMNPSADCVSPITAPLFEKGLRKEINAEFYASTTRPPSVYRGNPFIIEAAIAYGGDQPKDKSVRVMRFANRVPLLYQQGACASTKAITTTIWRNYGLSQSQGSLPIGPVTIAIHISSVWVPFTSESKEAIAHYPEIIREVKLALQEVGRKLSSYVKKKKKVGDELKKRSYIEKYIPHLIEALREIINFSGVESDRLHENLKIILEKKRGKIQDLKFDPTKNTDYDEELAKIGRVKEVEDDE